MSTAAERQPSVPATVGNAETPTMTAPVTPAITRLTARGCRSPVKRLLTIRLPPEGVGIPTADLPHVFPRFRRGGNVTDRISGTGIGLAGAARIVEQHGGTMDVESTEGQGSTFTLRLPLAG